VQVPGIIKKMLQLLGTDISEFFHTLSFFIRDSVFSTNQKASFELIDQDSFLSKWFIAS